MGEASDQVLSASYVLEYGYKRTVGKIIGRFLTGLREREIVGIRLRDGRVMVPPTEYDPETGEALAELVAVSDEGHVEAWAWIEAPRPRQPLSRPFGWALIRLDGADTALLHAVDAGARSRMRTGMRVRARWAEQRAGTVQDIECFEPIAKEETKT